MKSDERVWRAWPPGAFFFFFFAFMPRCPSALLLFPAHRQSHHCWGEIMEEDKQHLLSVRGDRLPIKVPGPIFKTWRARQFMRRVSSLCCHVASYPGSRLLNDSAQFVDNLSTVSEGLAKSPRYIRAFVACRGIQVGSMLHWGDVNLCFLCFLQEEEIPELEIDIDELLELTDEGQRTRLQVRLCKYLLNCSGIYCLTEFGTKVLSLKS